MTKKHYNKTKNKNKWHQPVNLGNNDKNEYLKQVSKEIDDWIRMFELVQTKYPGTRIFVKGGAVIGLKILSLMTRKTYKDFTEFYKLKMIKDWDFAITIPTKYDNYDYTKNVSMCKQGLYLKFFDIVKRQKGVRKFNSEGSIICVVRHNDKKFVYNNYDDVLFESSVAIRNDIYNNLTEIELPLTAMHYELKNIKDFKHFFNIAYIYTILTVVQDIDNKDLVKKYELDKKVEFLFNSVNQINIHIIDCKNGILDLKNTNICYDKMEMYKKYFDTYCKINKYNKDEKQFLINMLIDISRLLVRFNKNYNKSKTISTFLLQYEYKDLCWYVQEYNNYTSMCRNFLEYLYNLEFKSVYDKVLIILNNSIKTVIEKNKYDSIPKYEYDIITALTNNSILMNEFDILFDSLNKMFTNFNIVRVRDFLKRNEDKDVYSEFVAYVRYMLDPFLINRKLEYPVFVYNIKNQKFSNYVIFDLLSKIDTFI